MKPANPKKLRRHGRQVLDKYELLVRLTFLNTPEVMSSIAEARTRIETAKNKDLPKLVEKIDAPFNEYAEKAGFAVADAHVAEFLTSVRRSTPERPGMYSKWRLKHVLTNCEAVLPMLDKVPSHTCVMLDSKVQRDATMASVELWTLEWALYEHMAGVFNTARRLEKEIDGQEPTKEQRKTLTGLVHSCVVLAFFFLEGYLNGLAFDHLATNDESIELDDSCALTEWDFEKGRQQALSFRDKLLQYPKIVAGLDHPPLQESNCPEMALIVEHAKAWRDAKPDLKTRRIRTRRPGSRGQITVHFEPSRVL